MKDDSIKTNVILLVLLFGLSIIVMFIGGGVLSINSHDSGASSENVSILNYSSGISNRSVTYDDLSDEGSLSTPSENSTLCNMSLNCTYDLDLLNYGLEYRMVGDNISSTAKLIIVPSSEKDGFHATVSMESPRVNIPSYELVFHFNSSGKCIGFFDGYRAVRCEGENPFWISCSNESIYSEDLPFYTEFKFKYFNLELVRVWRVNDE